MGKEDNKIRNNINMESAEKALNSLKDLFQEIIQKNEALIEEIEKLKITEKERKEAELKELKAQLAELEEKARIDKMNSVIPPCYIFNPSSPINLIIEQQRRNLYG